MTCRVVASPAPQVTWFKNTAEITTGPDIKIYYDQETGVCTLEIAEVFPDDAGEITCRAVNLFGEAMTSATLIIQGETARLSCDGRVKFGFEGSFF